MNCNSIQGNILKKHWLLKIVIFTKTIWNILLFEQVPLNIYFYSHNSHIKHYESYFLKNINSLDGGNVAVATARNAWCVKSRFVHSCSTPSQVLHDLWLIYWEFWNIPGVLLKHLLHYFYHFWFQPVKKQKLIKFNPISVSCTLFDTM